MKATAQQVKGGVTSLGARPGARVQTKARPGAGNRHRADAHERQADEISLRILRNETGLAHRISPAPGGRLLGIPASTGSPLRADLRAEMEHAFDADLSAVRIHTDSAAAASAQAEYALAFTSGRDIYFGPGQFAPDTLEGRRLLAHELTHVLQQTGRSGAGNKRVATQVPGRGEIQRQDFYPEGELAFLEAPDDKTSIDKPAKAFEVLSTRHGSRPEADESLKGLIAGVRRLAARLERGWSAVGDFLVGIAEAGQYQDTPQDPVVKLTAPAIGFLVDRLKFTNYEPYFKTAEMLLDADTLFQLRTIFGPSKDFRVYLEKSKARGKDDWLAEAFNYEPLKHLWSHVFPSTLEQFLLNPWRPIQSLEGFDEAKTAAFKNFNGETPDLLYPDRMLMAFELLNQLDNFRLTVMSSIEKQMAKQLPDRPNLILPDAIRGQTIGKILRQAGN